MLTTPKTRARSVTSNTIRCTVLSLQRIPPGELPPPPPRACFGRDKLIEKIVDLAVTLTPIALIGPGGIGKTSVALAVLHDDRIKEWFGDNRRFIRCDQFPPSHANFLNRLSEVIGAGVENPEDLIPLRPFLSSKAMIIVLDNAESVLDPQGTNAREILAIVEELGQFSNICLCITSRITTVPSDCKCLDVPTLSRDAAHDAFYRIYGNGDQPDLINDILKQLDFHPLSITLLATVAHQNKWGNNRLAREWEKRQTGVLYTGHNKSLAVTIELSLASPLFRELCPDARAVLGVIAFFPQGVDEDNADWLFPTISNGMNIFDKFCTLSLTYRSNGFITMLAPLRDYLSPKDPKSSRLLCTAKERYFTRLSADLDPDTPGFGEARWIMSEDVNVEHLLSVFTSIDANSGDVWDACVNFMKHLYWHKSRLVILRSRIEGLPDDHRFKPKCLFALSQLFDTVGNHVERKRLLTHTLKLERERGDNHQVVQMLRHLSDVTQNMGHSEEGIQLAKEALGISELLSDLVEQARCLIVLAQSMYSGEQVDAAEEAASRAINLLQKKDRRFQVGRCHRILGYIHRSKGEREKAIYHFEAVLGIASSSNWHNELCWTHQDLARLFSAEGRFSDAQAHIEQAKAHATDNAYYLGLATELQAEFWYKQHRHKEAKSEALRAIDIYEKIGAVKALEGSRSLLQCIEEKMGDLVV